MSECDLRETYDVRSYSGSERVMSQWSALILIRYGFLGIKWNNDGMTKRFEDLSDFILNQMRMSHIYQPAMLVELLQNSGRASVNDIAKALLSRDISQIEYYEQITKNMVGRVLTQNRGITDREGNTYSI